jgi:hypothetical protein
MRTSILLSVLAMMIVAPAVHSQQAPVPHDAERAEAVAPAAVTTPAASAPRITEAPRAEQTAPMFEVAQTASPAAAAREVSARTVLAVVGGVLIVVALISLLR